MLIFTLFIFFTCFAHAGEIQVGDPNTSYASVEFSQDGRYMIWYEGINGNRTGKMWHCEMDPTTGALTPSDCKGFSGFATSVWGRANAGQDALGPFYVGANQQGETILVRPNSATTGEVTKLPTPTHNFRKGFYSTRMNDSSKAFVVWMEFTSRQARSLQFIDLSQPEIVYTVETQYLGGPFPMVPMDIGFFRIVEGSSLLTYGAFDQNGKVQVKIKDLSKPHEPAFFVTDENHHHIDPFGFKAPDGNMYLVAGVDGRAELIVYRYDAEIKKFRKINFINIPTKTKLQRPSLACSFEPVFMNGKIMGTYQINNRPTNGRGYIKTSFESPGEIWLVDILQPQQTHLMVSEASTQRRTEPEPVPGRNGYWLYYNASEDERGILETSWKLKRTSLPLLY